LKGGSNDDQDKNKRDLALKKTNKQYTADPVRSKNKAARRETTDGGDAPQKELMRVITENCQERYSLLRESKAYDRKLPIPPSTGSARIHIKKTTTHMWGEKKRGASEHISIKSPVFVGHACGERNRVEK